MYSINDIKKLKDRDIKNLSYSDAYGVVTVLSEVVFLDLNNQQTLEEIEAFKNIIAIIEFMATTGAYKEIEGRRNEFKKESFLWRLSDLSTNFNYMISINNSLNKTLGQMSQMQEEFIQEEHRIDTNLSDAIDRLKDSEHTTLNHVMSLLGVFTAIITIIITLFISSSSWLKNSDKSDAFFAFVVPNAVVLIAVSFLMLLVYFFIHQDKITKDKIEQRTIKNNKIIVIGIILGVIILFCTLLSLIFINTQHSKSATHIRYIIPPSQYRIVEDTVDTPEGCHHDSECNCKKVRCIEFTYEGTNYSFEYDESLKHGENLYFCEKHCTLE